MCLVFNDTFFFPYECHNHLEYDFERSLLEQENEFREDELFVRFSEHLCLDIGYDHQTHAFKISLVKDADWENRLFVRYAYNIYDVVCLVSRIVRNPLIDPVDPEAFWGGFAEMRK